MKWVLYTLLFLLVLFGTQVFAEDVVIGTQKWMPKNLDVSTYRDGTPIRHAASAEDWIDAGNKGEGAWCYYNNDPLLGAIFGKLYNWYAVNDPRGLAPEGYHVPNNDEWWVLIEYLGGVDLAGGKLKEEGFTHWLSPNTGATNERKWTGLPGGVRYYWGNFSLLNHVGWWWIVEELDNETAFKMLINYNDSFIHPYYQYKADGLSVRCVKDSSPTLQTGLLTYYPFNGNANDESGNGNNGTVNGASLTTDRFGNTNSAYNFDGVDDFISFPVLYTYPPIELTFAAWIKPQDFTNDQRILYHGDNGEFQFGLSGNALGANVKLSNGDWRFASTNLPLLNKWYQVIGTWKKGDKIKIFIDGELKFSYNVEDLNLFDPSSQFLPSIGCLARNQKFFKGGIDDIRLYNRELSVAEIAELFFSEAAVQLVSPANTAIDQPRNVTLKWDALNLADSYQFEVSLNSNFTNVITATNTTSTSYMNTNLSNGKTYYWRVRAKKGDTYTQWSEVRSFTTVTGSIDLESGLVAHYPFEEDANDYSGNSLDGSIRGSTIHFSEGKHGNAIYFHNYPSEWDAHYRNDYVILPNFTNEEFTVSYWMKFEPYSSGIQGLAVYSFGDDKMANDPRDFFINWIWNMKTMCSSIQKGSNITGGSCSDVNDNKWHFVTNVVSKTYYKYYIDGQLLSNKEINYSHKFESQPHYVAYHQWVNGQGYSSRYSGGVDELRIYNRALNDAEVAALYGPQVVINPKISISKSLLSAGETQVISASGYPANKEVRLHIFRANSIIDTFDIVTDIDGKFTKNYATDNDFYAGLYLISSWVKDNANISSNQVQFELTKEEPEFEMWIVMPKTGDTITLGQPFQIVWYDKMNLWGQDSINGSYRYYKYLIEYKKPNKDYWIPLDTVSGLASLFTQIMFNTMVTIKDTSDVESIRVIDLTTYKFNQGQKKKEDELQAGQEEQRKVSVDVNSSPSNDLIPSLEWDLENLKHWTNNNTGQITNTKPYPLGVVADGNSRIILKLKVINIPQNQSITKVEIRLNHTKSSDITGKVEYYKINYGNLNYFPVNLNPKFDGDNPQKANCTLQPHEYQTVGSGEFYFWYQAPLNFGDVTDFFIKNGFRNELFNFKVYLKDDNTGRDITGEIFISLPPLYLVAGVGGNEDGKYWNEFKYDKIFTTQFNKTGYIKNSGYFSVVATPQMNKTSGYDSRTKELIDDKKIAGIYETINKVLKKGVSCTQVDWVGHSMGGALGRAFQEYFIERKTTDCKIISDRTYGNGYLHKLITISSPHIGAPGGNILVDWVNYFNNLDISSQISEFENLVKFLTGDEDLSNGIQIKGGPIIKGVDCGLYLGDYNIYFMQVEYLRYLFNQLNKFQKIQLKLQKVFLDVQLPQKRKINTDVLGNSFVNFDPSIEKGVAFEEIKIPNHLIGSYISEYLRDLIPLPIFVPPTNTFNYYYSYMYSAKFLSTLVMNIFQNPNKDWIYYERFNIDKLYSIYGYTKNEKDNFLLNESDIIIGRRSQLADRSKDVKFLNFYKEFYDGNIVNTYNHGNTKERVEVGNYVMELLLSSINPDKSIPYPQNSKFANILEKVEQPEIDDPVFNKTQNVKPQNENEVEFNSIITLNSPTEGEYFPADSLINVSFEISDLTGLLGGSIEFQNQYYYADSLSYSNVIKIPVLYDKIGENYLKLSVQFNHNDELKTLDTLILINVISEDDLIKLSVEPNVYTLKVSESVKPNITAYYEKGITDISSSFKEFVNVEFSNDTIVTFDSTYKEFTASNLGTTTATIKYKGKEEIIYFEVDGILPKPDSMVVLISPSNESTFKDKDIYFSWNSVNNTLTYTLEVAKDTNFYNLVFDGRELLDTFSLVNDLEVNSVYYWRVRAVGLGGVSNWSETWSFTLTIDHNIPLTSGWNLISTHIQPQVQDSVNSVLDNVEENLVIAKNNSGSVYIPQFDINSIGRWDVTQGYQLYMSSADTLVVTGLQTNPSETPITLNAGWNMIAYLRNSEMEAPLAFASITDNGNLVIAKNLAGQVYIPSFGINSIGNLIPGQGYRVYVTNADSLIYPDN